MMGYWSGITFLFPTAHHKREARPDGLFFLLCRGLYVDRPLDKEKNDRLIALHASRGRPELA